jgi:hypothetical protein
MRSVRRLSGVVAPVLVACLACQTVPDRASGFAVAPAAGAFVAAAIDAPAIPAALPAVPSPAAFEPTTGAPSAASAGVTRGSRRSPIQTLNQMLTTQALLVSLLLTPLGKDAGHAPMARLDTPAP